MGAGLGQGWPGQVGYIGALGVVTACGSSAPLCEFLWDFRCSQASLRAIPAAVAEFQSLHCLVLSSALSHIFSKNACDISGKKLSFTWFCLGESDSVRNH